MRVFLLWVTILAFSGGSTPEVARAETAPPRLHPSAQKLPEVARVETAPPRLGPSARRLPEVARAEPEPPGSDRDTQEAPAADANAPTGASSPTPTAPPPPPPSTPPPLDDALPGQPREPQAQTDAQPPTQPNQPQQPKKKKEKKQKKAQKQQKQPKKPQKRRRLDVRGRVFVRDTITAPAWDNQLAIASARIGVRYRDRKYRLRIEVDAELADGDADIRDAYVQMRAGKYTRVRIGRFKRPISAIALTSRWSLPVIERGFLNDLQLGNVNTDAPDELPLGRATGVQVNLRNNAWLGKPRLTVGIFRSAVAEQVAESSNIAPITLKEHFSEDVFARVRVEPMSWLRIGASFAGIGRLDIAGDRDTFGHTFVSGLDVVADWSPWRVWLEGLAGQTPLHLGFDVAARGWFTAARAIAAVRWRAVDCCYLEPHVSGQFLDASSDFTNDRIYQGSGGVNLGFGKAWRLQVAVDYADVETELLYNSRTQFIVQLGAVI